MTDPEAERPPRRAAAPCVPQGSAAGGLDLDRLAEPHDGAARGAAALVADHHARRAPDARAGAQAHLQTAATADARTLRRAGDPDRGLGLRLRRAGRRDHARDLALAPDLA